MLLKVKKKSIPEIENETLPNNYQLINKDQIKMYITNIEPLNEEDLNELKRKRGKSTLITIICLLVMVGTPFLFGDFELLKESIFMIVFLFVFCIIYLIIKFIKTGSISNNYNNCLKAKLYIYDKKTQGYDDSGSPMYYARVWDGNKYVINEWLYLPTPLYDANEVIVYFGEYKNDLKMFIYNKKGI